MKSLRLVAWVFVALALALLGADLISSLEAGQPVIRTTREILNLIPGVSIPNLSTAGIAGIAKILLDLPLWTVVGVVGLAATILVKPVE